MLPASATKKRSLLRSPMGLYDHSSHLDTARWFFNDFVKRYPASLTWITVLGFAAVALQAGALVGIKYALEQLGSPGPIVIPYIQTEMGSDEMAMVVGLFLLVTLGSSAFLSLIEVHTVLQLWQRYQLHALDSLLVAIRNACQRSSITVESLGGRSLLRPLRQVAQLGAFSRIVAASIAPALRFLVFSTFAAVAQPLLTLALLVALVPSAGLALLLFARKASHASRAVVDLAGEETAELDHLLKGAAEGQYAAATKLEPGSAIIKRARALVDRLLWAEYARFAATIITTVVFLCVGFVFYSSGATQTADWSSAIVYLLALFLAFRQLITLSSKVSAFGRFYPAVVKQKELIEVLDQSSSPKQLTRALGNAGIKAGGVDQDDETY